jgi:hypothetical protein
MEDAGMGFFGFRRRDSFATVPEKGPADTCICGKDTTLFPPSKMRDISM